MSCSLFNHKRFLSLLPILASCLVVLLLSVPEYSRAEEVLSIGRMKIAIWPEYDDPGVLVIYDGRFADSSRFPIKTSFFLPKDAVISDACSLSPRGQHFCQLYEIIKRGEFNEVKLFLPFPNFYLSFHTYPDAGKTGNRAFDYHIRTNHKIETLELDIQQPLRSTVFNLSPASETSSKEKGFNHFKYTFSTVPGGEHKLFKIAYTKQDQLPSVDIKYSRMSGDKVWGSPYATQRQAKSIIYIVFFSGLAGLMLALSGYVYYRRKQKRLHD